jgi:ribosomal protein S18 acetylase RimI-like enzyme
MSIAIAEESAVVLPAYAGVSIAFTVESRLRVELLHDGLDGVRLTEERVDPPYVKDYDQIDGAGPESWPTRFDVSNWGVIAAFDGPRRVGGAVIAWRNPELKVLGGSDDVAALWDIRVDPELRRTGYGSRIFERAAAWARDRKCRALVVETQNINVPACRFYARHGCRLSALDHHAYASLPDEVQLIWRLDL